MDDRKIVEVARAMLEEGGLASLSMRKLATELGVAPTAIYWHVGGREELLGRILDDMTAERPPILPVGDTPRARIRSVAHSMRSEVHLTPLLRQLSIELGRTAELALPCQVVVARELAAAGLSGDALEHAATSLLYTVGGFIALDVLIGGHLRRGPRTHELWSVLEPEGVTPEVADRMRRPSDEDAVFARTVDLLLDALLPPDPPG